MRYVVFPDISGCPRYASNPDFVVAELQSLIQCWFSSSPSCPGMSLHDSHLRKMEQTEGGYVEIPQCCCNAECALFLSRRAETFRVFSETSRARSLKELASERIKHGTVDVKAVGRKLSVRKKREMIKMLQIEPSKTTNDQFLLLVAFSSSGKIQEATLYSHVHGAHKHSQKLADGQRTPIKPALARIMSNFACVRNGGFVFDPFVVSIALDSSCDLAAYIIFLFSWRGVITRMRGYGIQ